MTRRVTAPPVDPGRGRGRIPFHRLRVEGGDRALEVRHKPHAGAAAHRATPVRDIAHHAFDRCPICLAPGPTSREHVPPRSLGGRVRTLVCEPCNHRLGSHLEGELLDWRDMVMSSPRASAGSVLGHRKLPRVFVRSTPQGEFVLVPDGPVDPAVREMLVSGQLTLAYRPPDANRYRLAALKHAYLAACLDRREIPHTPSAEQIRADLVAARDAPSAREVPASEYAAGLRLMRSYQQPGGPSLALALVHVPDGPPQAWILLAGAVCVSWPMPDLPPAPATGRA